MGGLDSIDIDEFINPVEIIWFERGIKLSSNVEKSKDYIKRDGNVREGLFGRLNWMSFVINILAVLLYSYVYLYEI